MLSPLPYREGKIKEYFNVFIIYVNIRFLKIKDNIPPVPVPVPVPLPVPDSKMGSGEYDKS